MDSIQRKVELRKAQIIENLNTSLGGEIIQKGEKLTIEQFKDELQKGEVFLTSANLDKFNQDVNARIVKAFTPEDKDAIRKSAQEELSMLIPVTIQNEFGKSFQFFKKGKKAQIGEIREWNGKKVQKTPSGWKTSEATYQGGKNAVKNISAAASENRKNPFKNSKIAEHEGKFYLKRGDYFQRENGEGFVQPDPNFSFSSQQEAEKFMDGKNK